PDENGGHTFTPRIPGDYAVAYSVMDAAGGLSQEIRTISVGGAPLVTAVAAPVVGEGAAVEEGGPDVRFAAIGDIHVSWDELAEAYDFWAEENVQSALFVGDLTN